MEQTNHEKRILGLLATLKDLQGSLARQQQEQPAAAEEAHTGTPTKTSESCTPGGSSALSSVVKHRGDEQVVTDDCAAAAAGAEIPFPPPQRVRRLPAPRSTTHDGKTREQERDVVQKLDRGNISFGTGRGPVTQRPGFDHSPSDGSGASAGNFRCHDLLGSDSNRGMSGSIIHKTSGPFDNGASSTGPQSSSAGTGKGIFDVDIDASFPPRDAGDKGPGSQSSWPPQRKEFLPFQPAPGQQPPEQLEISTRDQGGQQDASPGQSEWAEMGVDAWTQSIDRGRRARLEALFEKLRETTDPQTRQEGSKDTGPKPLIPAKRAASNAYPVSMSSASSGSTNDKGVAADLEWQRAQLDPWDSFHAFLTIKRRDFASGTAFLAEHERLAKRCRDQWKGLELTESFLCAHLIRAMRSWAPGLASAMMMAHEAGELNMDGVQDLVRRDVSHNANTRIGWPEHVGHHSYAYWRVRAVGIPYHKLNRLRGLYICPGHALRAAPGEGLGLSEEAIRELGFIPHGWKQDAFRYIP